MRYLAGVAAQGDSAVEGCRSKPDGGSIGTACEHQPQPDVLPAVGAYPVRLLKSKIFAPPLEEERADRRRLVWKIEHDAANDLEARAQRDRICGIPSGLVKRRDDVLSARDEAYIDGITWDALRRRRHHTPF